MKQTLRYICCACFLLCYLFSVAQTNKWREIYKVKRKDTLFGIAKKFDLAIPDLMEANPDMKKQGYELKKGEYVFIPFSKDVLEARAKADAEAKAKAEAAKALAEQQADDVRKRAIRVGIMLPLHDIDGDGRRMVEYYRGVLLACDSLKRQGISTNIHAWNVPITADIRQTLLENGAKECDIIFGPLYTKQVKALGDFCRTYQIKMVIPFSISSDEVEHNPQIFQVYQSPEEQSQQAIKAFIERFPNHHLVLIDCNDTTSKKGIFTFNLRKEIESQGKTYNITNLKSSEIYFAKAFSEKQPNIVVLNTGRSPELNMALAKLNTLKINMPALSISLFGYTEWLMYAKVYQNLFHKYNTYIPTNFYYNPTSQEVKHLEQNYQRWFHATMQNALPRFAITGYDQAQFFLRGLHEYGKEFKGLRSQNEYKPLQTTLNFKPANEQGGMRNRHFMLIHYKTDQAIEAVNY